MKRSLVWVGLALILAPWLWAFTLGASTVNEAQGSGSAAFYASVVTVPLGVFLIAWGLLKKPTKRGG